MNCLRWKTVLCLLWLCAGCDSPFSSSSSFDTTAGGCNAQIASAAARLTFLQPAGGVSHVPAAVKTFSDRGKYDESQSIPITLSLPLNHVADLEARLAAIYSPGNSLYGKYMKPAEFRAAYAPTEDQVAQVKSYFSTRGVEGLTLNANGYLLSGRASVKSLNTTLQTEIHQYQDAQGNAYFAPSVEPTLPEGLPLMGVLGLDNVAKAHPALRAKSLAFPNGTGSGHAGAFAPADIRTAYNIPSTLNGAGQTLGLFEMAAFDAANITKYRNQYSIPAVTVTAIPVDGANTTPPSVPNADPSNNPAEIEEREVELDIELQLALAPGAKQILVYEGNPSPNLVIGMIDAYAKIAQDNLAKEISTSWGIDETAGAAVLAANENNIFIQMAMQGQTIFAATGDGGAYDIKSSPGSTTLLIHS